MTASPATPGPPPLTTRRADAGQALVLIAVFLGVLLVLLGAVVSVSSTDAAYGQAQDAANAAALRRTSTRETAGEAPAPTPATTTVGAKSKRGATTVTASLPGRT